MTDNGKRRIMKMLLKFGIAEPEKLSLQCQWLCKPESHDRRNRHERSNRETVGGGVLFCVCAMTMSRVVSSVKQSSSGGGVGSGGVPIVGSRCIETPSENVEDLVSATVNSNVSRLARALQLLVIRIHKCPTRLSIQSHF
jgi:hypothetical protein